MQLTACQHGWYIECSLDVTTVFVILAPNMENTIKTQIIEKNSISSLHKKEHFTITSF